MEASVRSDNAVRTAREALDTAERQAWARVRAGDPDWARADADYRKAVTDAYARKVKQADKKIKDGH